MRTLIIGVALVALLCGAAFMPAAEAGEIKYELNKSAGIKDVLNESIGKRVALRMDGGNELEGTVVKVGDQLVHISKLTGRDFFDAVVRLDRVDAIVFRVKSID